MIRYRVRHLTTYRYAHPVRFARCNLRLAPLDGWGQRIEQRALRIDPPAEIGPARPGGFPVTTERAVIARPATSLAVESRFEATVTRATPSAHPDDPTLAAVAQLALDVPDLSGEGPATYLPPSPLIALSAEMGAWCGAVLREGGVVAAALALARRIQAELRYDGSATGPTTRPAQAFAARAGVCQDFAQIMIAGARFWGVPAAYVSGYLRTTPPPGQPRLVGADASHAWAMLWCGPERGWIGFDPTNGCLVGQDHIILGIGRDYADVAPIDGLFSGQEGQSVAVEVDVEPV